MMDLIINNNARAEIFSILFQHIKVFSEHVNIIFEEGQMFIQCLDSSRVSIMEIRLPKDWFDTYSQGHGSSITIGLNSNTLFRILNARDKTQNIVIHYDLTDNDKLFIHFTSEAKKDFDKHFELPLIELENDAMEIPPIEYQAEITLSSQHFAGIVGELKMFGDTIDIQCSEDKIMLVSKSQDQGKMFVEIKIDDVSSFSIDEGAQLELSYSLAYLHNICLYHKITKEVELKFSSEYPMQVAYQLGHPQANVLFYLAPKINED